MLEAILTTAAVDAASLVLDAMIEGRSLTSSDSSSFVTSMLKTIVDGQRTTESDAARIEAKLDERSRDPYNAAMTAGSRLLEDASAPHRRPDDRHAMLTDARLRFFDAIGHAQDRRADRARAEVMCGLTWLALGSPEDLRICLTRAARDLEDEILVAFALVCRAEQDTERRRRDPLNRAKEALIGSDTSVPDFTASDRLHLATDDHEALQLLRNSLAHDPGAYPLVQRPSDGTDYSVPSAGLLVRLTPGRVFELMGIQIRLGRDPFITNLRTRSIAVAAQTIDVDHRGRVAPDTIALQTGAVRVIASGGSLHLDTTGEDSVSLAVRFGHEEGVDLLAKFHSELDERFRLSRLSLLGFRS